MSEKPPRTSDDAGPEAEDVAEQLQRLNATLEEQVRERTALINMLHDVASHVHEATTLQEAVQFVLRRVAEYNGWSFGHAFLATPEPPHLLEPLQVYHQQSGVDFHEFRKASAQTTLQSGEGLPGRAFETGEPVWAENLPDDLRPGDAELVAGLPIESAAAFPIAVDGRVELVLEFFCSHPIVDDERIRQGMSNVAIHLARTIERLRAEKTLRESEERFRELAESINQVFWVWDPASDRMLYVSPEWSRIVGLAPPETSGDRQRWRAHLHPDDRRWVEAEFETKARQGLFDVVYRVVRTDGDIRWVHDLAVPIHDEAGNVRRVIGVASDVTERRELEREIADAATHEQQRLSRDLHDSIGQELTGLTMMAAQHVQALALADSAPAEVEAARHLVEGLKRTLGQVRRVARGLAAFDIGSGGLSVALAQLAEQTGLAATVECTFRGQDSIALRDAGVARHLYQIAQEAVSNAVKHAVATKVVITLSVEGEFCQLTIEDDGRGLPETYAARPEGIGLRIMRHRASLIGGQFEISNGPSGGTRVRCRVRQEGLVARLPGDETSASD